MPLNKYSSKTKDKNINNIKKPLLRIRKKIDIVDDKIHDLLMKRGDLVSDVIKIKRKESIRNEVIYRPAREHEILERLIKRHKGNISIKSLISIWRNIISTYISLQGELKVTFPVKMEDKVKNYFSSEITLVKTKNSSISLKNLNTNKANIAILPFPSQYNDWWSKLYSFKNIFIIGSLFNGKEAKPSALILSKQNIEYSSSNIALYTLKINSNNLNKYKKFLTYNGCNLICKKIINSSKTNILFSSKVLSNIDNKNKLLTLKNFELEKKLKPNYIGTFAVVDEEIL